MTIEEVLVRKRWMRLAMPDDVAQCVALAKILVNTPHSQAVVLEYLLKMLRHEVWDRNPTHAPVRPRCLKPSVVAASTGYKLDSTRKKAARAKVSPERRSEIARLGAQAKHALVVTYSRSEENR